MTLDSPGDALFTLPERIAPLVVVSNGSGQDSSALIARLALDTEERERRGIALDSLIIVGADTSDEHAETYLHIPVLRKFCEEHGIEFVFLTPDMGFHQPAWQSLIGQFRRNDTVGSQKGFKRSCTANLKISVVYAFLDDYVAKRYELGVSGSKRGLRAYVARYGKIRVYIGFTRGEESRIGADDAVPSWMADCIVREYPIMDWGWDRMGCQEYLRSNNLPVPYPSQCVRCHYKSPEDLVWTQRLYPEKFDEWVELEQRKLAKFAGRDGPNYGVFGSKTLREVLAEAQREFGHLTTDELLARRMTRGHCIINSY